MAAFSQFLSHLYSLTTLFFTLLLLQLVIFIRSIAFNISDHHRRPITTTQYLKLIEEKNPTSQYTTGSTVHPVDCAVCLSIFEEGEDIRKLKCKHTFHKDCFDKWLQLDRATCPLCRSSVLPEKIMVGYHRQLEQQEDYGNDGEFVFFLSAFHGHGLRRLM